MSLNRFKGTDIPDSGRVSDKVLSNNKLGLAIGAAALSVLASCGDSPARDEVFVDDCRFRGGSTSQCNGDPVNARIPLGSFFEAGGGIYYLDDSFSCLGDGTPVAQVQEVRFVPDGEGHLMVGVRASRDLSLGCTELDSDVTASVSGTCSQSYDPEDGTLNVLLCAESLSTLDVQ